MDGYPVLNTAIDDGNAVLRARLAKALRSWLKHLQSIIRKAQERSESRSEIDPKTIATLILATSKELF